MTVSLALKPEIEAKLVARARARGVPLDTYLQDVIEDLALAPDAPAAGPQDFRAGLDALAEMGKNLPPLPAAALRRENIYQDHD